MRLVLHQGGSMVTQMTIHKDLLRVGSSRRCEVYLPDLRVAQEQLMMVRTADGWVLHQLDATRLVLVNRSVAAEPRRLKTGDEISLADYVLTVYPEADEPERPQASARPGPGPVGTFQLPADAVVRQPHDALSLPGARLEGLTRLSARASQCRSVQDLMSLVVGALIERLTSRVAWIGLGPDRQGRFAFSLGRTAAGEPADWPGLSVQLRYRCVDRRQYICLPSCGQPEVGSVLAGPLLAGAQAAGMLYADRGPAQPRYGSTELDVLRLLAAQVTPFAGMIAAQQTRQETQPSADQLGLAQQIQARLAPAILPRWDELDIAVFREPGSARTGDMYDIVQLPNGLAGIVIAHASANGPDPAIMISQVQAAFRVSALHGDAPHVLMRELNWLIYDAQSDHRLACCAVLLEPRSGAIEYCTAGQPGAHIIDQSGRARGLVGLPNPPVGAELASTYASRPEQLDPAEVLVLFTPGFETLSNRSHQPFGRRRLIQTLCSSIGQRPTAMLDDLATELRIFRQAGNQPDDITVLLVRREAHQPAAT